MRTPTKTLTTINYLSSPFISLHWDAILPLNLMVLEKNPTFISYFLLPPLSQHIYGWLLPSIPNGECGNHRLLDMLPLHCCAGTAMPTPACFYSYKNTGDSSLVTTTGTDLSQYKAASLLTLLKWQSEIYFYPSKVSQSFPFPCHIISCRFPARAAQRDTKHDQNPTVSHTTHHLSPKVT